MERSIRHLALLLKRTHYPSSGSLALLDLGKGYGKEEADALGNGFADLDDFVSYAGSAGGKKSDKGGEKGQIELLCFPGHK